MKNSQRGFVMPLLLALIAILLVGGGAYVYVQSKQGSQSDIVNQTPQTTSNIQAPTPTPPSGNKSYPLSLCGINVTVRTGQTVKTDTGNSAGLAWGQLIVGDAMPNSVLEISCTAKNKNPQSDTEKFMNNVSDVLDVQSAGSSKANKDQYMVFDKQTLSSITNLYSAKDRGYRIGSETIGFETKDWIYTFSFTNPEQAKNQETFVISVVTQAAQTTSTDKNGASPYTPF